MFKRIRQAAQVKIKSNKNAASGIQFTLNSKWNVTKKKCYKQNKNNNKLKFYINLVLHLKPKQKLSDSIIPYAPYFSFYCLDSIDTEQEYIYKNI